MTINTAIDRLEDLQEAFDVATDTMRKYQKIQEILEKVWNIPSCMIDKAECLDKIMETYRTVRCDSSKDDYKNRVSGVDLNIELVIKIPERILVAIQNREYCDILDDRIYNAISNGIQLPKGHGRLGDLDALRKEVSSWGMDDYEPLDFTNEIDWTDTIIEADKEQTDGNSAK